MFSITTMASSMRMPMDSDSPINVITLRVKPSASMRMNEEITDTGSARDVIAVAFQSFRKSMTMMIVSRAPRTSS
jgi:hypothetical protein